MQFDGIDGNNREEMVCEEAELGPEEYSERLQMQQNLHQQVDWICVLFFLYVLFLQDLSSNVVGLLLQQLEMLKQMRNYGVADQSAILEKV